MRRECRKRTYIPIDAEAVIYLAIRFNNRKRIDRYKCHIRKEGRECVVETVFSSFSVIDLLPAGRIQPPFADRADKLSYSGQYIFIDKIYLVIIIIDPLSAESV